MPLPAALRARLEKRGLIPNSTTNLVEEIIAEDYGPVTIDNSENDKSCNFFDTMRETFDFCPNKYNPFHVCTNFCEHKWKIRIIEPDPSYLRKRRKMLKKYPLSDKWEEIYDKGTARFFYWNTETDKVSWLPPKHPKAQIVEAASVKRIKELKRLQQTLNEMNENKLKSKYEQNDYDTEVESTNFDKLPNRLRNNKASKNDSRSFDSKLDPMDPSAYSDVPRGTWATGLNNHLSDANSDVDSTAQNSSYQMRPYPSPRKVLELNKCKK